MRGPGATLAAVSFGLAGCSAASTTYLGDASLTIASSAAGSWWTLSLPPVDVSRDGTQSFHIVDPPSKEMEFYLRSRTGITDDPASRSHPTVTVRITDSLGTMVLSLSGPLTGEGASGRWIAMISDKHGHDQRYNYYHEDLLYAQGAVQFRRANQYTVVIETTGTQPGGEPFYLTPIFVWGRSLIPH